MRTLTEIPTLPPRPDMKRAVIRMLVDLLTGHSAFQNMYHEWQNSHAGFLPYISEKGAMTKGPKTNASRYIERDSCVADAPSFRSAPIWAKAGAIMLVDIVETKPPMEIIVVMAILRENDQL